MRLPYKKILSFILPALILALVFLLDFAFYFSGSFPQSLLWLRESLIACAFLLLVPAIMAHRRVADRNVITKLRGLFLGILGVYLSIVIPKALLKPSYDAIDERRLPLFSSMNTFFYSTIAAILATVFLIAILFILKDLIYYKCRRHTRRNFKLLCLLILFQVLYVNLSRELPRFQGDKGPLGWILFLLLVVFMVINSFRTSWVNYLNKKQKISTFWAGVLALAAAITLTKISSGMTISSYSVTLGAFDRSVSLFLSIYIGTSLLSVLLHLPTAAVFDRKVKEVSSLHDLSRMMSSVLDLDKVMKAITDLPGEITKSDFCWLELLDEGTHKLYIASSKNLTEREKKTMNLNPGQGISGWIIKNKEPVLINEIYRDERTRYLKNWKEGIGSLLGVPLISQDKVMGILYAMKQEEYGFEQDDCDLLQAFANQAVVAIENARLVRESIEKERLEQELKVAHDAQMKLLPKEMPVVEGLDIDAICITANEVGGDYYDFLPLNRNRLGIIIGDVSGKGISAAFYMAEIKGIIRAMSRIYSSPRELLIKVNQTLYDNIDRKTFISLIYAIIDAEKGSLVFSRAGHCPLLYFSQKKGETQFLQPPGLGLGLDRGEIFQRVIKEERLKIYPGDVLLFYTDGITEARNENQEEYEEGRLAQALFEAKELSSSGIKSRIVDRVRDFIGAERTIDDLSMVVVKVVGQTCY